MTPADSALRRVLDHLRDVERWANGWRARCPCCGAPDSIGIALGTNHIAMACWQGCTQVDVLAAAGLELSDLRIERTAA